MVRESLPSGVTPWSFLAVDLARQLLPGTFEHALNYLIDHEIDLSGFDTRYKNDLTGAAAYPPAMLLKITLFAYSRGMVSSRAIERACREHATRTKPERGKSVFSWQGRSQRAARR